jgi:hypothetical protein
MMETPKNTEEEGKVPPGLAAPKDDVKPSSTVNANTQ